MKKFIFGLVALVALSSHDMFLRLDTYFLAPDTAATILLYNGTFDRSDNTIDRNRMQDVSLVGNGQRMPVDTAAWTERDSTTVLHITTGVAGTYVAGVSTRPRNIAMAAEAFNNYLEHDGVVDMLATRRQNGDLGKDAVEQYSKHVKTIFQVGERRTDDWVTPLDYPIEFIPRSNPYDLQSGDSLVVLLRYRGEPLADQLVLVGSDHAHAHGNDHDHSHSEEGEDHQHTGTGMRTADDGTLTVPITSDGTWHLRTIYMTEAAEEDLTHESNWATLTFAVDHGQSHDHAVGANHDHDHSHEEAHDSGLPTFVYVLGSLLLVGTLFFFFNRKS
ncbi:DUF4198 domain-containing protein [Neolewinella antarctica]|uniref:NikM domain containing protein n=1 Tax=Neolewinella antarctica TaxID=442734 RepID=A0ABX0X904_9BACT|nr:DUF4198 domain-containing protein [Neolewinella antarctica]NJC25707.1 hypothetical protein [Neolewinella antarctica]